VTEDSILAKLGEAVDAITLTSELADAIASGLNEPAPQIARREGEVRRRLKTGTRN